MESWILSDFKHFSPWRLAFPNTFVRVLNRLYFYAWLMSVSFTHPGLRKSHCVHREESAARFPELSGHIPDAYLQRFGTSILKTLLAVDLLSQPPTGCRLKPLVAWFIFFSLGSSTDSWQPIYSLDYPSGHCLLTCLICIVPSGGQRDE